MPSLASPGDEACGTRAVRWDKASISWQRSRMAAGSSFPSQKGGRKLAEEAE